jgi:hypothetical protein
MTGGWHEMANSPKPIVQTSEVPVPPEIETDESHLYWSIRRHDDIRLIRPNRITLDQFLVLADGDPEQICRFARKYGVLGICVHGKPSSHNLDCDLVPGLPGLSGWAEPLDRWRHYARQFKAVLRIIGETNQDRLGRAEDWALLDPQQDPTFSNPTQKTVFTAGVAGARKRICGIISDFVVLGAVMPELFADGPDWKVYYHSVGSNRLFGSLVIQLILAIAGVDGFATCSACGNPYLPERFPKTAQNNYCSLPCRKVGAALASRKYRRSRGGSSGSSTEPLEAFLRALAMSLPPR